MAELKVTNNESIIFVQIVTKTGKEYQKQKGNQSSAAPFIKTAASLNVPEKSLLILPFNRLNNSSSS